MTDLNRRDVIKSLGAVTAGGLAAASGATATDERMMRDTTKRDLSQEEAKHLDTALDELRRTFNRTDLGKETNVTVQEDRSEWIAHEVETADGTTRGLIQRHEVEDGYVQFDIIPDSDSHIVLFLTENGRSTAYYPDGRTYSFRDVTGDGGHGDGSIPCCEGYFCDIKCCDGGSPGDREKKLEVPAPSGCPNCYETTTSFCCFSGTCVRPAD